MRIGLGYDVHKLGENRKMIIGGVEIPYELGLVGHSDADVLLHAVMDALLGAAGMGDIGKHFPDTDDKYKGISSVKLLRAVNDLLKKEGFIIGNIDVTILSRVIDRGLQKTGRLSEFTVALTDKPGELNTVSKIISKLGANVVAVSHDRADLNTDINSCYLRLSLETRNHEHIQKIKDELARHGYKIVQ